jgi:hypothetical protein
MRIFFIGKLKVFVYPQQKSPKTAEELATEMASTRIMTSMGIRFGCKRTRILEIVSFSGDYIFSNILSARYIQMLNNADQIVYNKFAQILVKLLNNNFLTLNALNDQLSALMKENWSEVSVSETNG